MHTKTVLVVFGDTHFGSSTAIAPPKFLNDEGQEITYNKAQEWLYVCFQDFWAKVKEKVGIRGKGRKSRLIVVHLGDVIDGIHHHTVQALPNLADQENMACQMLLPIVNLADGGYYQIRGTEAHAGLAAQSEVRIARELGAAACEYELDIEIDGLLMNFAHHGRAGGQPWTSAASSQAGAIVIDRALAGHEIPRFVFRGHRHTLDDSGQRVLGCQLVVCPSWQLKTAYGYKVASGRRSDIGGLIVEDGVIDFSLARYMAQPGEVRKIIL